MPHESHMYSSSTTYPTYHWRKRPDLKSLRLPKSSNKCSRGSPYLSSTFSREFPNFHTGFHVCKQSLRHSKDLTRQSLDHEIQIFYSEHSKWVSWAPQGLMRLTRLRADSRGTPTARERQRRMSKKRTRGEWDAGVENKNTQNTQINLNKQKLGEP